MDDEDGREREETHVGYAHGRVNLLGDHTDYNDGFVLPTAIPQRTRVQVRASGTGHFTVDARDLGVKVELALEQPPKVMFAKYVFGCLRLLEDAGHHVPPLDIVIESEVPLGVGLSSSAALEIALLRALRSLLALPLSDEALARVGQRAELDFVGVACGIMDQMAASFCSVSEMLFLDTRSLEHARVPLPSDAEILVLDSGVARSLAETAYNDRRAECELAAARLGLRSLRDLAPDTSLAELPVGLARRVRHVLSENARVLEARAGVSAARFGALMGASHASLRDDYEVSTEALDALVAILARHPDVYGARLTGAGFGGACVALCRMGRATVVARGALHAYAAAGGRGRMLVPSA